MSGAGAAASSSLSSSRPSTIKLISAEKDEFIVERRVAMVSGFLRSLLSSDNWLENTRGEVNFPSISTSALKKAIEYMEYKVKYTTGPGASDPRAPIPQFNIPVEDALELLATANFLDL